MTNTVRIFGSPEEFSDGREVVREATTEYPIANPDPAMMPNGAMTRTQAAAELQKLAEEDGWTALYDPTNADFVTTSGSNIVEIRDVLGNMPPLVPRSGTPTLTGDWGSVRTMRGVLKMDDSDGSPLTGGVFTALGLTRVPDASTSISKFFYSGIGTPEFRTSVTTSGGVQLRALEGGSQVAFVRGDQATPSHGGDRWTFSISSRGEMYVGNFPAANDSTDDDTQVEDVLRSKSVRRFEIGSTQVPMGPLFLARGPVSREARERANRLLSLLSDSPLSISEPEGSTPGGYFVGGPGGVPFAWHRPDRPLQLASLTKIWSGALALNYLKATYPNEDIMDRVITVPQASTYLGGSASKAPRVHRYDMITVRDALHGSLLVSHNQLADTLAYAAYSWFPGDVDAIFAGFADYMTTAARSQGWDEATFSSPSGFGNNVMSSRHFSELMEWVRLNVPEIVEVMGTEYWHYTLTLFNPPDPEDPYVSGDWHNLVTSTSEGVDLPELVGGKGGLLTFSWGYHRTIAAIGYSPVSGDYTYTTALNTGQEYAFRYRLLRYLWTGEETRNGAPLHWTSGDTDSLVEWRREGGDNYAVAFRDPGGEGAIRARPMDPFLDASIRVEPGDVVEVAVWLKAPVHPVSPNTSRLVLTIDRGLWGNGSDTLSVETVHSTSGWVRRTLSGTVRRGGILDVYVDVGAFNEDQASVFVRDFDVTWRVSERTATYFELPLRGYSANESAQSIDSSDPFGSVGSFTAECVIPESGSVIQKFGPNWLKDREARIYTRQGEMQGFIQGVQEVNGALLTLNAASVFQDFVSQNAIGEPFSGSLEFLLYNYINQAPRVPSKIVIDPALRGLRVTAPHWEGSLWTYLKLLGSAYGFNLRASRFEVIVEPAPRSETVDAQATGLTSQIDNGTTARFVEVVKYSGRALDTELVYPPGGVSSDTTILSVDAGQSIEVEVATNTSLSYVARPEVVDRVGINEIDKSVYSVADDNGRLVSAYEWSVSGGDLRVRIGPDRSTVILTVTAPPSGTIHRVDGSTVETFTLGSLTAQGPDQFSTIRLLGSGVDTTSKVIRVPTGDSNAVTEVGASIDNPFVTSMSQVAVLGSRAAMKYGGFRPTFSVESPGIEFGTANGAVDRPDYDYRVTDVTHDAGSSSLTAEYYMSHGTYEGFYSSDTYGDVEDDMTSPDVLTYSDDLIFGKRRP